MKLFLATKNQKKLNEMQRILTELGVEVVCELNSDYRIDDVEETGTTFEENAYLKAASACRTTGLPALADDSGLCVDALDGAPGIYSARFAGEGHNDSDNNEKLLDLLKDVDDCNRGAKFVCAMCCVFPNGDIVSSMGECYGKIAREYAGSGGFGYDPLFLCEDKTFAEYTGEEKDRISHRGRAIKQFKINLEKYLGEHNADK